MSGPIHSRESLLRWESGGKDEILLQLGPHLANLAAPSSVAALTCAIYSALASCLTSSGPAVTPSTAVAFLQSLALALPSSSSASSPALSALGELIVDAVWTIDAGFEETSDKANENKDGNAPHVDQDRAITLDILKQLLRMEIISPKLCRERLDFALLVSLRLVDDKGVLERKEVRARTALFYKQNKFNLLREQTEGYTKLTTELAGSVGPPHDPTTGLPVESPKATEARAKSVWKKVLGLIGYFDLDPNRALDVVIDVFAAHLTTHHTFFLALLRESPWCRATSGSSTAQHRNHQENTATESPFFDELRRAEGGSSVKDESEKTPVCAQVVGFKFVYFQEKKESTPRSLLMTAALMIREGLMVLEDIYSHLGPSDEDMSKIHDQYLEDLKKSAVVGQTNALSSAAPLVKDDIPQRPRHGEPAKPLTPQAPKRAPAGPKRPVIQKIGIVSSLLAVGCLRPAIGVLSSFPWLVESHPEIADLLLRVLQVSIGPLFKLHFPSDQEHTLIANQPRVRWSSSGPMPSPEKKQVLTLWAPVPPSTLAAEYHFFYPAWSHNIPLCQSDEDMLTIIEPFLAFLGHQIHRDLNFFTKLCQIARPQLQQKSQEHPLHELWYRLLRKHILPGVSMTNAQSIIAVELWNILKNYDPFQRWQLYAEWGSKTLERSPQLQMRKREVTREVKNLLRRLSHENVDRFVMVITKLSHSNPCILYNIIVNQVQAYDNMVPELIKVVGKPTVLPHDVLTFVLVDAFSRPDKEHVKEDGISTSDWITSLSLFASGLFRAYTRLDLPSMLRYIIHQLRGSDHKDTVILQDLISQMCGIYPLFDLSETQIVALRGGPILRTEAIASNHRGVLSNFTPRTADRFNSTLKSTNLLLPLLILIAQNRQSCVHVSRNDHLKTLGHLYDTSQAQLTQYIEALNAHSNGHHYAPLLPPLKELCDKYGIESSICMLLYQPKLRMDFALFQDLCLKQQQEDALKSKLTGINEGDSPLQYHSTPLEESPWVPMLESLFEDIRSILPSKAHDFIGVPFYATFWQLTMYDLVHPSERHNEEYNRLRGILKSASEKLQRREGTDVDELQRIKAQQALNGLISEGKTQIAHISATHKRMEAEKSLWFASDQGASKRVPMLAIQIIKYCLHPRALLSQSDADFSAYVIQYLHSIGTPGFHTTAVYDKLLDDGIITTIFSCSEQEALNYGRFLFGILGTLAKLHRSEEAWKKHNTRGEIHLPGFQRTWSGKEKIEPSDLLQWSHFKTLHKKWHKKLAAALARCLASQEYIHIHNAIVILKEILDFFPVSVVNAATGAEILARVETCLANETRQDLQILIGSYKARLNSRKAIWEAPDQTQTELKIAPNAQNNHEPVKTSDAPPPSQLGSAESAGDSKQSQPAADGLAADLKRSIERPPKKPRASEAAHDHTTSRKSDNTTDQNLGPGYDKEPGHIEFDSKSVSGIEPPKDQETASSGRAADESMPPPIAPSSTTHAEELRIAARNSMQARLSEGSKPTSELITKDISPAPARRSESPPRTTPRNTSPDSRTSGSEIREKEDGGDILDGPERGSRVERERSDAEESQRERPAHIEHDRPRDRERERDKARGGDRDQERDRRYKDTDRDRFRRDWDKDRDSGRDRERDRERERGHREGDRGTGSSRREPNSQEYQNGRHSQEDGTTKRRRHSDDEGDRGDRRSSRYKDSPRDTRDDRPPRQREREPDREADRRPARPDRDVESDRNSRHWSPEHESSSRTPRQPPDSKRGGNNPPSAPRAMSSADTPNRPSRQDTSARDSTARGWKRGRDRDSALHHSGTTQSAPRRGTQDPPSQGNNSRGRGGDTTPRDGNAPTTPKSEEPEGYDDGSRKRPFSDRVRNEKDNGDPAPDSDQPSKRRKTFIKDRERYKQAG